MGGRARRPRRLQELVSAIAATSPVAHHRVSLLTQTQQVAGNHALRRVLQDRAGAAGAVPPAAEPLRFGEEAPSATSRASTPTTAATRGGTSRPGAAWPRGPITRSKSVVHDLLTYVSWVREVERAYGPDVQAVLQRLRRLYYSTWAGAFGAQFDAVIDDQPGAEGPPLEAGAIPPDVLDGLYETGGVRTLDGDVVDIAHVLAALDLAVAGPSTRAIIGEGTLKVHWAGVLTWTGDLAWWFVKWVEGRQQLDVTPSTEEVTDAGPPEETGGLSPGDLSLMQELAQTKIAKDDLLGDLDATVIAAEDGHRSSREDKIRRRLQLERGKVDAAGPTPVSRILEQYYGVGIGTTTPSGSRDRFARFIRHAVPAIPHTVTNAGRLVLASGAEEAVAAAIRETASLFLSRLSLAPRDRSDPLLKYDLVLREMARRFTRFLATGLATGDAPWP